MVLSWGRAHRFDHEATRIRHASDAEVALRNASATHPILAHGLGRSYGDVALNDGERLALTPNLNAFLMADWDKGIIRAAAGLSIDELLSISVPKGWFVPVSPGTKYVTLGGAVANDVHGKNHHLAGSFGAHVTAFELVRSDIGAVTCSRSDNADLFAMTIGGLGLTGILTWVEVQLKPIQSSQLLVENLQCKNLEEFFSLSEASSDWEYTVTWVDCFAPEKSMGRGVFSRGRFSDSGDLVPHNSKGVTWPITTPSFLLNRWSIAAFNALYRNRPAASFQGKQHYDPFFYPLDKIRQWNRLYGANGFFQHQCIIPLECGDPAIRELLSCIRSYGQGSFLAVLKVHGVEKSPGVMSFCREGVSLALDFSNKGESTLRLLSKLDEITLKHGGRVYPAKDGRMSSESFKLFYPNWAQLEDRRDPHISSSFWRRVAMES